MGVQWGYSHGTDRVEMGYNEEMEEGGGGGRRRRIQ